MLDLFLKYQPGFLKIKPEGDIFFINITSKPAGQQFMPMLP